VFRKITASVCILSFLSSGCKAANTLSLAIGDTPTLAITFVSMTPSASATLPPLETAQPIRYLEFSDLMLAQRAATFPMRLPQSVPDDLVFSKAWISDYADGSENMRVVYAGPGDPLDANRKVLDLQVTRTMNLISKDSLSHQNRTKVLDIREVRVREQTGFIYWTKAVAAGNSAVLTWRESGLNFRISLFGAWPQPTENNPHGLDDLLLTIADGLRIMR
jgi:hypothetical protein